MPSSLTGPKGLLTNFCTTNDIYVKCTFNVHLLPYQNIHPSLQDNAQMIKFIMKEFLLPGHLTLAEVSFAESSEHLLF